MHESQHRALHDKLRVAVEECLLRSGLVESTDGVVALRSLHVDYSKAREPREHAVFLREASIRAVMSTDSKFEAAARLYAEDQEHIHDTARGNTAITDLAEELRKIAQARDVLLACDANADTSAFDRRRCSISDEITELQRARQSVYTPHVNFGFEYAELTDRAVRVRCVWPTGTGDVYSIRQR